ncbi:cytochrome oxidase c subunit VIb-domain-containing protein [Dipodascopsis tothii]|uniref:cytochrome oxidase c subunit VIb-domain-containing protein n=1 Tax=Dipodascopsis tothii TaxID=44089 RepID=UPI0034CDA2F9
MFGFGGKDTDGAAPADGQNPRQRASREKCWESRDLFTACLDREKIVDAFAQEADVKAKCNAENTAFERDCIVSWVNYFKQKRIQDYRKIRMMEEAEARNAEIQKKYGRA